MSDTTWFRTITRPLGHLAGTVAVTANAVVCAVVSLINPQLQPPLVLIGAIPYIVWFTVMAVIFHRATTVPADQT
ncbi:hypothetical protein [Microbacterium sp. EST19A]|uniref:hypothetical protein n=1 Tax=Microbacterium sp. EST19A TaxID=2862681 RepID=UPI001CC14D0C|nr:hypothetical protein [Microbacterium sp. EST19A]